MQNILAILFSALLIHSEVSAQNDRIRTFLQSAQRQYAPDRRTAVFDISYMKSGDSIILSGEIDEPSVKNILIVEMKKKINNNIIDKILLLPDSKLGNNRFGIVIRDVADIHRKPAENEELVTQLLMGMQVKLLKKNSDYYFIRMTDRYLGWIKAKDIYITDKNGTDKWYNSRKAIVTAFNSVVRTKPDILAEPLSDVVAGCIVKYDSTRDRWTSVKFADGRNGFLPDSVVQELKVWKKSRQLTGDNLEKTAIALLGTPYLWGGTSVRRMDCSGFIKTVYRLNGLELQRDADQQSNQGINVNPGKDFQNLHKGDLLFFGRKADAKSQEKITHVALYLKDGLFIHSSGNVHYGSFFPSSKYYDPSLLKRFIRARRLL